jgi:predicted NAD-dependent protein-ADP-ribosyltransferase YbiA (DUF1768 family)
MKVLLHPGKLVLVPQSDEERSALAAWKEAQAGHVLHIHATAGAGCALFDLGPRPDACREPIQVSSKVADPAIRAISNFAHTPFHLDGHDYASVEGFWQGLKFADETERRHVAGLWGKQAMLAGKEKGYGATVSYAGEEVAVGTWRHWRLMERACRAKFGQHLEARAALLATGERPLIHRVRRDSKAIPGVVMADVWMRVRSWLRAGGTGQAP